MPRFSVGVSFDAPERGQNSTRTFRLSSPTLWKSASPGHHRITRHMDHATNDPRNLGGGDQRTALAKQKNAQREEQVVALRIRQHSLTAIARVVGLSRQNCQKAFVRALHRSTTVDIHTHHRTELAELEAEAKVPWEMGDVKDAPRTRAAGLAILNRIHIRRAHLLGLDAPTKLDVSGIYGSGAEERSEERRENHRAWQAMTPE